MRHLANGLAALAAVVTLSACGGTPIDGQAGMAVDPGVGHGILQHAALPEGHPPVGRTLPPGHPAVPGYAPALPPGHPVCPAGRAMLEGGSPVRLQSADGVVLIST